MTSTSQRSVTTVLGLGFVACVAFAWRVLTFTDFQNDHFVHLARAQQLLLGDLPIRDFVDPGFPLMYFASAAAWGLWGGTPGTELFLVAGAYALAAALTFLVAHRLSGSIIVATAAALLEVMIAPRTYNYPKILVYAVAAYGILAVAESPSRRRVLLLAALTAFAFLFRHDHGMYVGLAGAVAVGLAASAFGWRVGVRRVALFAVASVAFVAPWLAFVEYHQGVFEYVASSLDFSRAEASRNGGPLLFVPFRLPTELGSDWYESWDSHVWLFYVFRALPVACAAVAWRRWRSGRQSWAGEPVALASLAVLGLLASLGLLRGTLSVWLPDAVALPVLLGAWLAPLAWHAAGSHPRVRVAVRTLVTVVLAISVAAVADVGRVEDRLDRTGMKEGIEGLTERVGVLQSRLWLTYRDAGMPPSGVSEALLPFFHYLQRCTSRDDRLIMTHLYPDVFVMAERGFAGGHEAYREGFYTSAADEEQMLMRLRRQSVPFVLIFAAQEREFRDNFDRLASYVDERYQPMTSFPIEGGAVGVLVQENRAAVRLDQQTGWPCFK
jgi:hypothetical protein